MPFRETDPAQIGSVTRFFLSVPRDLPEGWEKVMEMAQLRNFVYSLEDSIIVLRSHHDKWLSAEDDEYTVTNNRTEIDLWEKFQMVYSDNGLVGLKTWKGKFLSAQPDGTLEANRDDLNVWERFEMFIRGEEDLAFRSTHGKWLSAQPDGTMEVNRYNLDIWETFHGKKDGELMPSISMYSPR